MKVLVYSSAQAFGGHELIALKGLRALLKAGHILSVCFYELNYLLRENLVVLQAEFPDSLELLPTRFKTKSFQIARSWLFINRLFALKKIIGEVKPERILIVQGDIEQGSEMVLAARLSNAWTVSYIPMILKGAERGIRLPYLRDLLSAPVYRILNRVIVISDYFRDQAFRFGAAEVKTVFNTIDEDFFVAEKKRHDAREQLGISSSEIIHGFVGRISFAQKGIDRIVSVIQKDKEYFSRNRWLIVGDGPDSKKLDAELASRGLTSCVIRQPWTNASRVQYFDAMDLFVCVSRFEGVPLTMLEAYARGVPMVAVDLPSLVSSIPAIYISGSDNEFAERLYSVLRAEGSRSSKKTIEFDNRISMEKFHIDFVAGVIN